jgi:hypothetical protein
MSTSTIFADAATRQYAKASSRFKNAVSAVHEFAI